MARSTSAAAVRPVGSTFVTVVDDTEIDDTELVRLALLGDPDAPLPDDAVPWRGDSLDDPLLPEWYMPAPAPGCRSLRGWRRTMAWFLVAASLAVVASGLCNTYGQLVIA